MSSRPIIEPEDAAHDCVLFRALQVFIADRLNLGQRAALHATRTFMAEYRAGEFDALMGTLPHQVRADRERGRELPSPKDARVP